MQTSHQSEITQFLLLLHANEVCKGYVLTGVCLSIGGSPQADRPPRQTPPFCPVHADIHTPSPCPVHAGIHTPSPSTCWDMVNKRAVRIPLECILVFYSYSSRANEILKRNLLCFSSHYNSTKPTIKYTTYKRSIYMFRNETIYRHTQFLSFTALLHL